MVGGNRRKIVDRLPYIGLDIEEVGTDFIRVEYSPNRPDLGTDYGIARAMRGLLGKEVGLPMFRTKPSGVFVSVDRRLSSVRPYIACCVVAGLELDDEDVRQVISLQEDLHNGLGRKRKRVAIGLHDMDAISPPLYYRGVPASFEFVPLGAKEPSSMASILTSTSEGRAYGPTLPGGTIFPVICDSKGTVLSFPPIINGNATRVTTKTKRLFVDVTSTDLAAGDDVLAVMATTLAEAGGNLKTVLVKYESGARATPDLTPIGIPLDLGLVRSVLGLDLSRKEVLRALAKSRMGVSGGKALGPRYRVDLLHRVDVAEEVALGYGLDKIAPVYPPSGQPGAFNPFEEFLDLVSTVMAEEGMVELMTYELVDEKSLYSLFRRPSSDRVAVQDPKSLDHSLLRDSLIPSLMAALTGNVKSDYPQKVYEVGRTYSRSESGVAESWHLGCLVAHSQSSFTEAKMYLDALCRLVSEEEIATPAVDHWAFTQGRCAGIRVGETELGFVGELKPEAIEAFGMGVPVSGFELDLSVLYELLK
ncbi:MAG: phenylalanine--tRNA ligase subunit beta [Nitrososphaerota archaeon]|nr:phenylalanine--tRNA ligase subunit beta [Nitrososphaerota archaeon]